MAAVAVERQYTFSASKDKIFTLFSNQNHINVPNTTPKINCDVQDQGCGCTKKADIAVPDNDLKHVKTKDEKTDKNNYKYSYTIVEGEPWSDDLDKVTVEITVEDASNGGSILTNKSKYIPKPNCSLDEGGINGITDSIMKLYKHIDEQM